MAGYLVHDKTKQLFNQALQNSGHAVLFSGAPGAGKFFLACLFAAQKLGLVGAEYIHVSPYVRIVAPEKDTIGIEQIREVQKFLQLKTPGTASIRRVIIIDQAQTMTDEAQNALLKSLEEPPEDTLFVLTAPGNLKLKETIYSRLQRINVEPVSLIQAQEYFKAYPNEDVQKAYHMSSGYPGLLWALLNDTEHGLVREIAFVKDLLGMDSFQRLTQVEPLAKQKERLPLIIQAIKLICSSALAGSAKTNPAGAKQWYRRLDHIYQAETKLNHSPNPKLFITDLLLGL